VVRVKITNPKDIATINLALNKTSGEWDHDKLAPSARNTRCWRGGIGARGQADNRELVDGGAWRESEEEGNRFILHSIGAVS
jgi:hypothetical protein